MRASSTGFSATDEQTIIACATGARRASTALIRCSGPHARTITCALLTPVLPAPATPASKSPISKSPISKSLASAIFPGHRFIGHALFALSPALACRSTINPLPVRTLFLSGPRTFTGQDTLELLIPGNPFLIQRTLAALCAAAPHGAARQAEPGEFAARAFANGKLSLVEAESIAAIISAQSDTELAAANRVMNGAAAAEYKAWATELATLLALVEAGIDFADQDGVVAISPESLNARICALSASMHARLPAAHPPKHTQSRFGSVASASSNIKVVLVGQPNAGKSTLYNALLRRTRSITAPIAGTTRDAIIEPLTLRGTGGRTVTIDLVDVAGFDTNLDTNLDTDVDINLDSQLHAACGITSTSTAAQAVLHQTIASADVLLIIRPAGEPLAPALTSTINHFATRAKLIFVQTKSDLAFPFPAPPSATPIFQNEISVCALDGHGLTALRAAILAAAWHASGRGDALLPRHEEAVAASATELAELLSPHVTNAPTAVTPDERTGAVLRAALDALGTLTGRIHRDDVIGRIFSTFCIGK